MQGLSFPLHPHICHHHSPSIELCISEKNNYWNHIKTKSCLKLSLHLVLRGLQEKPVPLPCWHIVTSSNLQKMCDMALAYFLPPSEYPLLLGMFTFRNTVTRVDPFLSSLFISIFTTCLVMPYLLYKDYHSPTLHIWSSPNYTRA